MDARVKPGHDDRAWTLILPLEEQAEAGIALRRDTGARLNVLGDVEVDGDARRIRRRPLLQPEIDILADVAAGGERGRALLVHHDVEVVEAGRGADLTEQSAASPARKLRRRHAEATDLEWRQLADTLLEDQARQHL